MIGGQIASYIVQKAVSGGALSVVDPLGLAKHIADGTGATKQEYIPTIGTTVIVDDFTLSAFRVTRSGDTLVVRFVAVTKQIIDGQLYSKDPAPRIVTYQRTDGRWQMTSNANFNAPAAS